MAITDSKTLKIIRDYSADELIEKAKEMDMTGINDHFGESGAPWDLMKAFGLSYGQEYRAGLVRGEQEQLRLGCDGHSPATLD